MTGTTTSTKRRDTSHTPGPPTTVVLFGATGDLYRRKLLPALYQLLEQYDLVERCVVLGVATTQMSEAEFRSFSHEALADAGHVDIDCAEWCERVLHFEAVDGSEHDYPRLRQRIAEIELANDALDHA